MPGCVNRRYYFTVVNSSRKLKPDSIRLCTRDKEIIQLFRDSTILTDSVKQGTSDKALGGVMLLVASFVFVYYTTWTILLPFFDASSPMQNLFPPREWAVRLPAFVLVIGMSGIGFFVGSTIIKENRKKAEKARLRTA